MFSVLNKYSPVIFKMKYLVFVSASLLIQLSSAQVLSYGIQNGPTTYQNVNTNPRTVTVQNNGYSLQNNAINGIQNVGIAVPVSNSNIQLSRNLPIAGSVLTNGNLVTNNLANTNYVTSNLANTNYLSGNVGTNLVSTNFGTNIIPTNLASGNIVTANANNYGLSNNYVGANQNWVAASVPINLANGFNINTGSFALGNSAAQFLGNLPCGIQILADALEVGGTVGVNGQMPFYSTVAVNGQLPSSGYGIASCGCGGQ